MKLLRSLTVSLAVAAALTAAAEFDLPTREINGKTFYYYKVPPKATIYSITRTYNISREELIRYNPQVADGLRAGDVLFFPVTADGEKNSAESEESTVVAQQEEEELLPLPTKTEEPDAEAVEKESPDESATPSREDDNAAVADSAAIEIGGDDAVNVAVILPFMLRSENMTRQAENSTNFYQGMLLAIDSLAPNSGVKVNLVAIDTEASPSVVSTEMSRPDMGNMDFIIAPGDSVQIEQIAAVADSANAMVINLFAVKNDAHMRHESVLQANIPHDRMYRRAIEAFCTGYKDRKVLFLNATDIDADKNSFTDLLTESLIANGIPYESIDFEGKLTSEDLAALPSRNYVFVPTSSSREMVMKIAPSLIEYTESNPEQTSSLFGYPEWVVWRGDFKENLHRLNTVVYSRFSTDLNNADVAAVQQSYERWYGHPMQETVPNTVLLGFDTMAWIIRASSVGVSEPFTGVQNTFKVAEVNATGAGDVNNALYFINFTPAGSLDATSL